jgi:hypothetical protein
LRAGGVEIAGTIHGIEGGAGFRVGEVFEAVARLTVFQTQHAGGGIAGECWLETRPGLRRAGLHSGCALGICLLEVQEALPEPEGVCRPDGKYADATLRATGAAKKMAAASQGSIGERTVDQGDEGTVLGSKPCIRLVLVGGISAAHGIHRSQFRRCLGYVCAKCASGAFRTPLADQISASEGVSDLAGSL